MRDLIVVMFLFISIGMSRATATRNFNQCFPGWAEADQVTVSCNDIKIAQYCDPGHQSCRNISNPGVSLEKGSTGVCLTITNCSYDSRSCEALSYIDGNPQGPENFTVRCNQAPSTSPNPESTSTSPNPESTSTSPNPESTSTSPNPEAPSTSPNPGHNESHSGTIATWVSVPIFCLLIIGLIIFFILYKQVKCFRKAVRGFFSRLQCNKENPNQEPDIEKGEEENFLGSG